ncbi:hypothetical protein [Arthrobacter sp. B1805]|uniref:hypothetical protein n=1 Tax=Arthrobacter sp. B1805 TaxID=2058892 RepID=UPI000CE4D1DD|nr:hypothetical protein [Arthrobacter sp. B1805]
MEDDAHDDQGIPRHLLAEAAGRRWLLKLIRVFAIAVFALSMAFVLVYGTSLPWLPALFISGVLAAAQVYALLRTLFRGDGRT